jgi:hypothetical protein
VRFTDVHAPIEALYGDGDDLVESARLLKRWQNSAGKGNRRGDAQAVRRKRSTPLVPDSNKRKGGGQEPNIRGMGMVGYR